MTKCKKCGKLVGSSSKFCQNCGTKITIDTSINIYKKFPKWYLILYLVFMIIYIFTIFGIENNQDLSFYNLYLLYLTLLFAISNIIFGVYLIAKKYKYLYLVLPIGSLIFPYFTYVGFAIGIQFLVILLFVCYVLYLFWKVN